MNATSLQQQPDQPQESRTHGEPESVTPPPASSDRKTFLWAMLYGSRLAIIRALTGFIRVKFSAVVLGAVGVGILAQGQQLGLLFITIGSLGIATGLMTLAAQAQTHEDAANLYGTAFAMQIIATLVLLGVGFLASEALTAQVFGRMSAANYNFFRIVLFTTPIAVLASSHIEAIFFAEQRYDLYVQASIIATIAGLAAFVPLVLWKGLSGAFYAIPAQAFILVATFGFFLMRHLQSRNGTKKLQDWLSFRWNALSAKTLTGMAAALLLASIVAPAATIAVRSLFLSQLGEASAGLLQVPIALAAYAIPFLTNPLWGQFLPGVSKDISQTKTHQDRAQGRSLAASRFRETLSSSLWVAAALFTGMMTRRHVLVALLFTEEFASATAMMPLAFLGDFANVVVLVSAVYAFGLKKIRTFLLLSLTPLLVAGVTWALLRNQEVTLLSYPVAYASISSAMSLVILFKTLPFAAGSRLVGCLSLVALQTAICHSSLTHLWRIGFGNFEIAILECIIPIGIAVTMFHKLRRGKAARES